MRKYLIGAGILLAFALGGIFLRIWTDFIVYFFFIAIAASGVGEAERRRIKGDVKRTIWILNCSWIGVGILFLLQPLFSVAVSRPSSFVITWSNWDILYNVRGLESWGWWLFIFAPSVLVAVGNPYLMRLIESELPDTKHAKALVVAVLVVTLSIAWVMSYQGYGDYLS